jgi:hypothetical protein
MPPIECWFSGSALFTACSFAFFAAIGFVGIMNMTEGWQKLLILAYVVAVVLFGLGWWQSAKQEWQNAKQAEKIDKLYALWAGRELTPRQRALVAHLSDLRVQGASMAAHLLSSRATNTEIQQKIKSIQDWVGETTKYIRERMGERAASHFGVDLKEPTKYPGIKSEEYNANLNWLVHLLANLDDLIQHFQDYDDASKDIYDK